MLDIGTSGYTNSRIRCNAEVGGYTGHAELNAASAWDLFLNLSTAYPNGGWMYFKINNVNHMQLPGSSQTVTYFKPLVNSSDDRLKESEELIENACGTLPKLRPQLYDKKPDMENDDPTA